MQKWLGIENGLVSKMAKHKKRLGINVEATGIGQYHHGLDQPTSHRHIHP